MNARVVKKKGNYYISMEWYHNGTRKTKSISVRKELGLDRSAEAREAKALRDKIMHEHRQGTYVLPSSTLFKEFITEWIDNHQYNLKPTTHESYKRFIDNHIIPELGDYTLQTLRPSHLKTLYNKKLKSGRADGKSGGLSTRSVSYIHTILRECLDSALEDELIPRNIAKAVSPPTVNRPDIKYWPWDKAKLFLENTCNDRYYLFYLIALSTGMNRGEILGLRWQDVNWKKKTISVLQTVVNITGGPLIQSSAKTKNRTRTLDITDKLIAALKEQRKKQSEEIIALKNTNRSGLIFTTTSGNVVSPRNMDRSFERAIIRYNKTKKNEEDKLLVTGTHVLRHTYATHLLEEGVHPKVVQERLGHANIRVTLDTYSHVVPRLQKEVAALTDDLI